MTRAKAGVLVDRLFAGHPRTPITDATIDLWLDELEPLDYADGEKAVLGLIESVKYFPTIAHLHEQLAIVREQARRERQTIERREAELALEQMPRVELRDIAAVVEFRERHIAPLTQSLEPAPDGDCEDKCGRSGARYRFGRVALCDECARLRLRTRAALESKERAA